MPAPIPLDPDEALEAITRYAKEPRAIEVEVLAAAGHYLVEDVETSLGGGFPGDPSSLRRAIADGYAISAAAGAEAELRVIENPTATPRERTPQPGSPAPPQPGSPAPPAWAYRVELGDPLPEEVFAVLPARSVTLVAPDRLRVGTRITQGAFISASASETRARAARGTLVGARLAAHWLAAGHDRIRVAQTPRVAVVYLGRHLEPLRAQSSAQVAAPVDLGSHWLEAFARAEGVELLEVGRGCEDLDEFRRAFQRAYARQADLLLLVGGTGDGVGDRAAEWLVRIQGEVRVERVALDLAPTLLFGKITGMDVLGIGGSPRASAIGWDLFVHPYLKKRAGAAAATWDWRLRRVELSISEPLDRRGWEIRAATSPVTSTSGAARRSDALGAGSPFSPWIPGCGGWALIPPAPDLSTRCGEADGEEKIPSHGVHEREPKTAAEAPVLAFWCALTASEGGL